MTTIRAKNLDDEVKDLLNAEKSVAQEDTTYPVQIQADSARYSFFDLKRQIEEFNEIDMTPEFQRGYVWTPAQQSELIESILMGIPLPLFYFAAEKSGKVSVVDGIQRINAVLHYMNDEFFITKSKYLKHISGKKFSQLERTDRAKIEKYQIQAYIIPSGIPEQVKIDIFDRINRAGTKLNTQEIRHALYHGTSTDLLKSLAEECVFKDASGKRLNSKRMRDRYVILRFLAFYLWKHREELLLEKYGYYTEITSDFDSFLANYMRIINEMPDDHINKLKIVFLHTMRLAHALFGNNAFTKEHKANMPFNMTVFDSLCYVLASMPPIDSIDMEALREAVQHMESDFLWKTDTRYSPSSAKAIKEHFSKLDEYIPFIKG